VRDPQTYGEGEATHYLPSLDALRGLAVSMVVLFHVGEGASDAPLLRRITSLGAHGVDLFFVLSGFLISGILLETRGKPGYFRSFYMRRVLRIFPAYYLYLVLVAIALALIPAAYRAREAFSHDWPWYELYLTNIKLIFFDDLVPASVQHLWSLAVEEHFYLIWPAAVALVPARKLLLFTCVAIGTVTLGRALWLANGADPIAVHFLSWTRIDSLLIGATLAMLRSNPRVWPKFRSAAPVLAAVAVVPLVTSWGDAAGLRYTGVGLAFAALLTWCVAADERGLPAPIVRSRVLRSIGMVSYGIYLFHFFFVLNVGRLVKPMLGSGLLYFGVSLAVVSVSTWVLAALSYHWVETPALALKARFPRPGAQPNANTLDPRVMM
jgi:peptidoglycan/LPS O-acetylase OafA/YrhL